MAYRETRADRGYVWDVAYDLAFDGIALTVTTRIDLTGDSPGSLPIRWEQGIEQTWNVFALEYAGIHYDVRFDVEFVADGNDEHYDVRVIAGSGRDNMLNWYTQKSGWGDAYQELIAAHEYGHMIGTFDEYSGGATYQGVVKTDTLMSDLTAGGVFGYYLAGIEKYAEIGAGGGVDFSVVRRATDMIAPSILALSPAVGATEVPVDALIVIGFDETIYRGAGSLLLKDAAGATIETFDVSSSPRLELSGSTLTLDPSANLANGTTYTLALPSGIVKDAAGNGFVGGQTLNFSTVRGPNLAPTAADASHSVPEDGRLNAQLPTGVDPEHAPVAYRLVSGAMNGIVDVGSDGRFTYVPASDYAGTDRFTFSVSDPGGASNTYTIRLTVVAVNDAPVASDARFSGNEDTVIRGLIEASDIDGDPLSIDLIGPPAHGEVSLVSNSAVFTYAPDPDYAGTDTFTVRVSDGRGGADLATVTIDVLPVNDAPVAADAAFVTDEDEPLAARLPEAIDPEASAIRYALATGPGYGTLELLADGRFTYTPASHRAGPDRFTYTVSDPQGASTTHVVDLTVIEVNDLPVAVDAAFVTDEDQSVSGVLQAVDADGDPLEVTFAQPPGHGRVTLDPATFGFSYIPDADHAGTDIFTVRFSDGRGGADLATVTIDVLPVNDAPVATDAAFVTDEDEPLSGVLQAVDVDGDPLEITIAQPPGHGRVTLDPATFGFSYVPDADHAGPDTFTVRFSDGRGGADLATVTIDVLPVNDAPVATDAAFVTDEDEPLSGVLQAVDADGDPLEVTFAQPPGHGRVTLDPATFGFSYIPDADHAGTDIFTVRFSDGRGGADLATVTIDVLPVNDAPVATDAAFVTDEDEPLSGVLQAVDVDGDPLEITIAQPPGHGRVTLDPATFGFSYVPDADHAGPDTFTVRFSDGRGGADLATVTIDVLPVNDAPVATDAAFVTDEDEPLSGVLQAVDVDGDPLEITIAQPPGHGRVTLDPATFGFSYVPDADHAGPDTFTVRFSDGRGGADLATVTIDVLPVNDAPVAADAAFVTDEDQPLAARLPEAIDPEASPVGYALTTGPGYGTLELLGDGRFTYTPAANRAGPDRFTYTVSDPQGASSTHVVDLTVMEINDPPVISDAALVTEEDQPLVGVLEVDDADADSLGLKLSIPAVHGRVTLDPATFGFTYVPDADYTGADTFTVTVDDGRGGSGTASFTIGILPVNDPPGMAPVVVGAAARKQTLRIVADPLDPDGYDPGGLAYQWRADGVEISGATGRELQLERVHVGKAISVEARYLDAFGTSERITSTPTTPVIDVNSAPVPRAQIGNLLASVGWSVDLTVPGDLFSDPEDDPLTLTLERADGTARPGWLAFDPSTGRLFGTPGSDDIGTLELHLLASDGLLTGKAPMVISVAPIGAPTAPVAESGDAVIDSATGAWRWGLHEDRTLVWSVSGGLDGEVFSDPTTIATLIGSEVAVLSDFANIEFVFGGAFDSPVPAARSASTINVAPTGDRSLFESPQTNVTGFGPSPPRPTDRYPGQAGDLFIDIAAVETVADAADRLQAMHGLLNALGIAPLRSMIALDWPVLASIRSIGRDLRPFTVLPDAGSPADTRVLPATPMLVEVLALQHLYGANPSSHAGDTIHPLYGPPVASTIRDASGTDTLTAESANASWTILLPLATDAGPTGLRVGVALPSADLASDTAPALRWLVGDIENATGSPFDDRLVGNELDNRFDGGSGDDTIEAGPGDDFLSGGTGHDRLAGGPGNDRLDGGPGLDTARFTGPLKDYTLRRTADTTSVAAPERDGIDALTDIERLEFDDMVVNLTIQARAASIPQDSLDRIIELYIGFFGRVPAADGLENWLGEFANGRPVLAIAEDFHAIGASAELRPVTGYWDAAHDRPLSDEDYVRVVYRNVLGREGRAEGIDYWSDLLQSGEATRGSLVCAMLDSAHALGGDPDWGWVAELLEDRVGISKRVAVDWGLDYATTPEAAILLGRAIASTMIVRPNPAFPEVPIRTFDDDAAIALIGIDPTMIDLG